jgi:hypothetical protein
VAASGQNGALGFKGARRVAAENERNHRREQRRFIVEIIEIALVAIYGTVTVFECRTFDSERQTMEREFTAGQINTVNPLDVLKAKLSEMRTQRELDGQSRSCFWP